jgi:hypothetical protein
VHRERAAAPSIDETSDGRRKVHVSRRRWRREYLNTAVATVTETRAGYVMVFMPSGNRAATVRIADSLSDATGLADQMAGRFASESGFWVPEP